MINTEENKDKKPIGRGTSKRLKIGYIQLSGCIGDILSFTENFDDFTDLLDSMDIVYGQTLVDVWDMPDMDVVFVEGSLCLDDQASIEELKEARRKSKVLVALGSCAVTGGFTLYSRGNQQAQPQHSSFVPLKDVVQVDLAVPGCPVSPEITKKVLSALAYDNMDYLAPFRDIASESGVCGYNLQEKIVSKSLCVGCGMCASSCPTRAMTMLDAMPRFNYDRCVRCGLCYYQCTRSWMMTDEVKREIGLWED